MRDSEDEDLLARARSGDEEAFAALVDRQVESLRAFVRRRLPVALRRKVAESDVIQESLIVASRRISSFEDRGEGSFGRWLRTIVRWKLREEIRRFAGTAKRAAMREVGREGRPRTGELPGRDPTPSQVASGRELLGRVQGALAGLPEDYRRIILLVHERGLSLDAASERLGRSREAVRKLYGRALSRLSRGLGGGSGR